MEEFDESFTGICLMIEPGEEFVPGGEPKRVSITFIDSGMAYDPLAKPDPDVTLSAEERQIGGLGIYMVKKSMDDMTYAYRDGQNVLTITKNLE